jgi:putative SOS response-associated peptidase YedK
VAALGEAATGNAQRTKGKCRRQADIPRRIQRHRCIIPATDYYEWIARPDCEQPYFISAADGGALSLQACGTGGGTLKPASLWRRARFIVTDDNVLTRTIHDSIAVLLDKAQFASWLNGVGGTELLRSPADEKLRMWPVSRRVNNR